jgi:hypothetical protein
MNRTASSAFACLTHAPAAAVATRKVSSLSLRILYHHPEGMRSLSPGLRGTSYPGCAMGWGTNPERVASPPRPARSRRHAIGLTIVKRTADATLSGLAVLSMLEPRVARASQPWAERCNPFGIARNVQTPRGRCCWLPATRWQCPAPPNSSGETNPSQLITIGPRRSSNWSTTHYGLRDAIRGFPSAPAT